MPHQDVERFNAQASSYDSGWRQWVVAPVHKATLEFAASLNPRPREVLDVGCGTGALLRRAASRFPEAELVGVDPADQMIERARTRTPAASRARFICASAAKLPFDNDSFDLVVSTMSFRFWPHSAGLREVRRMLAAAEVEQLLDAAGLALPQWQPVLRAGPVPLLWAVAASKPVYQPPVTPRRRRFR